jgi:hypothetical protein
MEVIAVVILEFINIAMTRFSYVSLCDLENWVTVTHF